VYYVTFELLFRNPPSRVGLLKLIADAIANNSLLVSRKPVIALQPYFPGFKEQRDFCGFWLGVEMQTGKNGEEQGIPQYSNQNG